MRRLMFVIVMLVALVVPAFATPITTLSMLGTCGGTVTSSVTVECVGQFAGNTPSEWDGLPELFKWNNGEPTSTPLFNVTTTDIGGTFQYLGVTPLAFFALKYGSVAGSLFEVWDVIPNTPGPVSFTWVSPTFLNKQEHSVIAGTSHVSLYDTPQAVPEPGSMSLLGIGLMFIGNRLRKGWGLQRR